MRIDKFLWCVRKYKTRSLATQQIKKDRVQINAEDVKPSREVKPQDRISYKKQGVLYELEVLDIPKSRVGAKLVPDFIKDTTAAEELEKQEFINLMHKMNRPRGTGRPTKKDRRDLDDFTEGY
jgi:ribosome-associated heat shock protein Hsp15